MTKVHDIEKVLVVLWGEGGGGEEGKGGKGKEGRWKGGGLKRKGREDVEREKERKKGEKKHARRRGCQGRGRFKHGGQMCMHVCGCVVILCFSTFRRIVVDESRVTAAVWGLFDQFLIAGHA